jgi:hypothetical protein
MSWADQSVAFQQRYSQLSAYITSDLQQDIVQLNKQTKDFIASGGLQSGTATENPTYQSIMSLFRKIEGKKSELQTLINDVSRAVSTLSKSADTGSLLQENGKLQQEILHLEKQLKNTESDVETSIERDRLLRSGQSDITPKQLFLLGKPIRKQSIPWLWALSILFVAFGMLIFKQTRPDFVFSLGMATQGIQQNYSITSGVLDIIKDVRIWITLSISAIIVIIALALKITNII